MDFIFKKKQIFEYLSRNYRIEENYFIRNEDNYNETGKEVINSMITIFCFEFDTCYDLMKYWALENDLAENKWDDAYELKKLKAHWNPEMAQDLERYGISSAEDIIISMLSQKIAEEIDSEIIRELRYSSEEINSNDFLSIVKCEGYAPSPTVYDPVTFTPKRFFLAIRKNERDYERQNNTYWQNRIRARRPNQ